MLSSRPPAVTAPVPPSSAADRLPPRPSPSAEAEPIDPAPRLGGIDLARAMGMFVVLCGFVVTARTLADNSLFTHLATGRIILDSGSVPSVDPYSVTAAGRPWTVQSWLPSLIYAAIEAAWSAGGIRLLNGVLGAALAGGLWRLSRPADGLVSRAGLVLLPTAMGATWWASRPLLFALVLFTAALVIWQSDRGGVLLAPIVALWVNSHGSFPLLFVFLALAGAGRAADDRALPRPELRLLGWSLVGAALAATSGLGRRLLVFPVQLLDRREALEGVTEWSTPSFTHWTEYLFLVNLGLLVLAARRRAGWRGLLPALGFVVAGLLAVRNFAVAGPVVVATLSAPLAGAFGWERGHDHGRVPRMVAVSAVCGLMATAVAVIVTPPFNLTPYPVVAVDRLEQRGLIANPEVSVLHREAVGNYLTLRYGTRAADFIDDRFDFFPLDVVADHRNLVAGVGVEEIIARRAPDVVLWESDSVVVRTLGADKNWSIATEADGWTVLCRLDSQWRSACLD